MLTVPNIFKTEVGTVYTGTLKIKWAESSDFGFGSYEAKPPRAPRRWRRF